jgi:hypothetical protein
VTTLLQHRAGEVGADNPSLETGRAAQRGRQVEGAGAEVEVDSSGQTLPPELCHGLPPPALIEPEADDAIEAVVGGSDCTEDIADIGPLLRTA